MPAKILIGGQRGDEGKGRFTDLLAKRADIVGRGQGGNNAGHTVVTDDGRELALHSIPSGIAYEHTVNIIGRGCLINAAALDVETGNIKAKGFSITPDNLMINSGAHLILPHHISMDEIREAGVGRQGSTKAGISPTSAAKYDRAVEQALRAEVINNDVGRLYDTIRQNLILQRPQREALGLPEMDPDSLAESYTEKALLLGEFITDTEVYLYNRLRKDGSAEAVLEGAQAFWLDIDHGMWPYVTSSSTTALGVANGLGIPWNEITDVIEAAKLVQSHVGGGPFVTEITDQGLLSELHGDMTTIDAERGTTTGRTRRLGHLDLTGLKRSQWINGTTQMAVTKLDWVPRFGDTVKICVSYNRKGRELSMAPDAAYKLEQCTPNYVELPTWKEDIQGVTEFNDLPKNAKGYINFIETFMGVPITMIGVGPARDQVIVRNNVLAA